jgi:CheY-like chemotaxis protein
MRAVLCITAVGYELAVLLRQRLERCKLIALTGYGEPAARSRSRQAGFDAHLVKPVQVAAIVREIVADDPPPSGVP